jgi:hypothetical protein
MSIINVQCHAHLGDNIINFIFFYKIKDYIESNNITIHYYCHKQYHKNLLEFNCSENIKIFEHENKGHLLWLGGIKDGGKTPQHYFLEDTICGMFNIFLDAHQIPISVNTFEYEDDDLFKRFEKLEDKYKNVNILVINSRPLSGQYIYNKNVWDNFIVKLSKKYVVATSEKVNDEIICLNDFSVKNIAAVALNSKIIISVNTGPSVPLYNTNILNNIDAFYLFTDCYNYKTRKTTVMKNIEDLSFLL